MTWFLVTLVVVCASFSGTYLYTGDIWAAFFAGGIPSLIYMAGLGFNACLGSRNRFCRLAVLVVSVVILTGVSAEFMVMSSATRWQSSYLDEIRVYLERGMTKGALLNVATPVFAAYHRQQGDVREPLADVFRDAWDGRDWRASNVYLESPPESLRVYASIGTDGSITITGMSSRVGGADPGFHNVDGSIGYTQSRLHLTTEGMTYEEEN